MFFFVCEEEREINRKEIHRNTKDNKITNEQKETKKQKKFIFGFGGRATFERARNFQNG